MTHDSPHTQASAENSHNTVEQADDAFTKALAHQPARQDDSDMFTRYQNPVIDHRALHDLIRTDTALAQLHGLGEVTTDDHAAKLRNRLTPGLLEAIVVWIAETGSTLADLTEALATEKTDR